MAFSGPDATQQLSNDRVTYRGIDMGLLLVVLPEGGHVHCQETLVPYTCIGLTNRH